MYSLQEFSQIEAPECDCNCYHGTYYKHRAAVVYISMALPGREIKKIGECIREIQINRLLEMNILEAMILHLDEMEMPAAVEAMVRPLIEEDYVEEEYLQTVLEREKISSTSLCHIALPHGKPFSGTHDQTDRCENAAAAVVEMIRESSVRFYLRYLPRCSKKNRCCSIRFTGFLLIRTWKKH